MTVEKAKDVHLRHPGLSFPLDMDWLARAEGCELVSWHFLRPVREVKQGHWIGLAQDADERERRHLIAHALAHHLLHCGNQLSFHGWQRTNRLKQELEAEECAAHILMPQEELQKVDSMLVWEIADHFGVPEELARRRLIVFATDMELRRWQSMQKTEE